jgi:uncharacterized delta-60 repeat protein
MLAAVFATLPAPAALWPAGAAAPSAQSTVTDFGGRSDEARAVAVQRDGRVVVAGVSRAPGKGHGYFALARYRTDGTLDPSFGAGGRVLTDFGSSDDGAYDVLVLTDGRIVAAGSGGRSFENESMAVARYLPDGTPDPSFGGGDGRAQVEHVEYWGNDCLTADAVAAQPDGKLVLVGQVGCGGEAGGMIIPVVRLLPDGRPDPSFDQDGTQTFDFGPCDFGTAVALQRDGKILVAGIDGGCYEENGPFRVARLNPDGSFDRGFGHHGRQRVKFDVRAAVVEDVIVDAQGRILLVGSAAGPVRRNGRHPAPTFALARLTKAGRLDRRFGRGGFSRGPLGLPRPALATAGALLPDGRIAVAGIAGPFTNTSEALVCVYRQDGRGDPSVGPAGMRRINFGAPREEARAVAVDRSGGLIVAGSARRPHAFWDFGLARVNAG